MWTLGIIVASALAIGLSLGLFGAGGSLLTMPVFHHVLGLDPHAAMTSSLLVVAATSSVAMMPHARAGCVRWRSGLLLGSAALVASFAGGHARPQLPPTAVVIAFALVMIAAGVSTLLRRQRVGTTSSIPAPPLRLLVLGTGVGLLTGVVGAGGGFLLVPALVVAGNMSMRSAVGTSLFVVVLSSLSALASSSRHAPPQLDLVIPVAALAIASSAIGARLAHRLPVRHMQRNFGGVVTAIGLAVLATALVRA